MVFIDEDWMISKRGLLTYLIRSVMATQEIKRSQQETMVFIDEDWMNVTRRASAASWSKGNKWMSDEEYAAFERAGEGPVAPTGLFLIVAPAGVFFTVFDRCPLQATPQPEHHAS